MKLLFVSNYFNHHQKFVSDMFYTLCENYRFIATSRMREERRKLGYGNISVPEYVLDLTKKNSDSISVQEIDNYDAVIIGSAPDGYIDARQKQNKLVFRYSERIYKQKYQWFKWPFRIFTFYKKFGKYKNTYLLCSSAFTYTDYAKHFSFLNKAYKWGYFPETKKYDSISQLLANKRKHSLLWVGRFINWKHAADAINVAKRLKDAGVVFEMNLIGTGVLEEYLKEMIISNNLHDCVYMRGPLPPEQVRKYMEESEIFLFTSDRNEGWGAVLNEAMNSGCAVVASHAIGSVPYLIKDNENGLIYTSGDVDMLYEKTKYLLDHPDYQIQLGRAAYETIVTEWNAEIAAERFLILTEHILKGEKHPDVFTSGPCSKAEIIKDNWYGEKRR